MAIVVVCRQFAIAAMEDIKDTIFKIEYNI
jgi:hypothetical protein